MAAIRARESALTDGLFVDPYADKLAGEEGRRALAAAIDRAGEQSTVQIVVRTRFWDEALLRATRSTRQVVILAAGMDSRAYRLPWPDGTTVFELDQPRVIATKDEVLGADEPSCRRVAIACDLVDDWPAALRAAGFNSAEPTVWLLEGLLQYLDAHAVHLLFDRVAAMSAPGSVLLYDVVGQSLLTSPSMAPLLRAMAEQGSPWLFGSDQPGDLAEQRGWKASVTDIAEPSKAWGRQIVTASSGDVDAPRGYFVEAHH